MNSLSPIRQFAASDIRPVQWSKGPLEPAPAAGIPLNELQQLSPNSRSQALDGVQPSNGSFGNVLSHLVDEVGAKQTAAGEAVRGVLSGQNGSLHQAMIAMEEASVSFQLMVEVRNKLLESYQELMRMQI
jgi:flagellar hook-basal body complex protein FliE